MQVFFNNKLKCKYGKTGFVWKSVFQAGCEYVAHALQGITELNPGNIIFIDGIKVYDLISRRVMMQGHDVDHTAMLFMSMYCGTLSRYL